MLFKLNYDEGTYYCWSCSAMGSWASLDNFLAYSPSTTKKSSSTMELDCWSLERACFASCLRMSSGVCTGAITRD